MRDPRCVIGGRAVDLLTGVVEGKGMLRPRELALLRYLLDHRDRVVPGDELLGQVWGYRTGVRTRTLYSTIYRLRERLEVDPSKPTVVLSERGEGYRIVLAPQTQELPAQTEPSVPAPVDRFVGREVLLASCALAFERSRLVTLVGGPGFGKTRLAQQLAQGYAGQVQPSAVLWVSILPDTLLWPVLARMLSLDPAESELARAVSQALRSGPRWLVLDDADRLGSAEREGLQELLRRAPELTLLATAREPLALSGERLVEVGPLTPEESEALLRDRMPDATSFEPTLLSKLTARVHGIPLALELASALIPTLGLAGLLEALEQSLETLELAASPLRPGLEATIARSWAALPEPERRTLLGLAVFQGPFTLEAARAVTGADALGAIARLTRRSLLHAIPTTQGARYRILDPIRETLLSWAPDAQLEAAELAHAHWFYGRVRDAKEMQELLTVARELPDLRRAAVVLGRRGRQQESLQLVLWLAGQLPLETCSEEVLVDLSRAADLATDAEQLGRIEACRARMLRFSGHLAESRDAALRAVRLAVDPTRRAIACIQLMLSADRVGDRQAIEEATAAFEAVEAELAPEVALKGRVESARAWLQLDPERTCAQLAVLSSDTPMSDHERLYLDTLRTVSRRVDDDAGAERVEIELRELIRRYGAMGSEYNAEQTRHVLIHHLLRRGRAADAQQELQKLSDRERHAPLLGLLSAWTAWLQGDALACQETLQQALPTASRVGDPLREGQICAALGQLERGEGRGREARQWWLRAARAYPAARHELWEALIEPVELPGQDLAACCVRALIAASRGERPALPALPFRHELDERIGVDLTRRALEAHSQATGGPTTQGS